MKRAATLLLLMAALAGCTFPGGGAAQISASQFNYEDYRLRRIALYPVVVNPLVSNAAVAANTFREAVSRQMDTLAIYDIETPENTKGIEFPYTPARLVAFGKEENFDAVIGVNLTRVDVRPVSREWSVTGNIIFADVKKPERYWALTKTWRFLGEPGDTRMLYQLLAELQSDFFDVRRALRRGTGSVLLRRDTVITETGPILALDAADWQLTSVTRTTATGEVEVSDPSVYVDGQPRLQIDYSAIDDSGIATLMIENAAASFRAYAIGDPQAMGAANQSGLPVFLADRLLVPLALGLNDIKLTATNKNGQSVIRNLQFTSRVSGISNARELLVIAANQFKSLPGTPLVEKAQREIAALDGMPQQVTMKGARAMTFSGERATREQILQTALNQWGQVGAATRRELALIGRAELVDNEVYVLLYDSNAQFPEIGALSMGELQRILGMGVSKATLELCTRESRPELVRQAFERELDARAVVSVTSGCERPLGEAFLTLDAHELADDLAGELKEAAETR